MYRLTKPRLVIESKLGSDCALPDDKVGTRQGNDSKDKFKVTATGFRHFSGSIL